MASPFSIFRKNQRASMAVLVVLSIIAFVVAPALQQMMGASFGAADGGEMIVTWDGGGLSVAEANKLQQTRGLAVNFFKRLASEVQKTGKQPNVPGFNLNGDVSKIGINTQTDMQSVVQTRLLEEYARRQQIEFDDDAAKQFLRAYVNNALSNDKIKEIKEEATGGRLSNFDLYGFIKTELTALTVTRLGYSGVMGPARAEVSGAMGPSGDIIGSNPITTAADRWQTFVKFNQRASIKAYPILVEDFLDKVDGEPSEPELLEIYEGGKNRIASKFSPLPGFQKPYEGVLEYVGASLDSFVEVEVSKLSEEEIQSEYDRLVNEGRYQVPAEDSQETTEGEESVENTGADGDEDAAAEGETSDAVEVDSKSASTEEMSDDASGSESSEAKSSEAKSSEVEASETSESGSSASSEEASEDKPKTDKEDVESGEKETEAKDDSKATGEIDNNKAGPDNSDQSLSLSTPAGRLVRFQKQDDTQADTTDTTTGEETASADPESSQSGEEGQGTENVASTETASTETASSDAATSETASSETASSDGEDGAAIEISPVEGTDGSAETAPPPSPKMRTQTLEEVRDELTRNMVVDTARSKLNEAIATVQLAMSEYYEERSIASLDKESDESVTIPEAPDLKALAAENALEYKRTELVDIESVDSYEISKALLTQSMRSRSPQRALIMLQPQMPLYFAQEAVLFQEGVSSTFVVWKSEESASRVEDFEDVRQQVEAAWKKQQARDLAMAKAEGMVSQAKEVGESPWSAIVSEQEADLVLSPPSFTWLAPVGFQGGISLSTVDGLPDIGNSFMESVFAASKGDWGVVSSANKDQYYVFELVDKLPDDASLKGRFSAAPVVFGGDEMSRFEAESTVGGWRAGIRESLNVQWSDSSILLQ